MAIILTDHFRRQMATRAIPDGLPEQIYAEADWRVIDRRTGYYVAIKRIFFRARQRDMAVAYEHRGDDVVLVTIHPLKRGQRERRIASERWQVP